MSYLKGFLYSDFDRMPVSEFIELGELADEVRKKHEEQIKKMEKR